MNGGKSMRGSKTSVPVVIVGCGVLLLAGGAASGGAKRGPVQDVPSLNVIIQPQTTTGGRAVGVGIEERIGLGSTPRTLSLAAPLKFAGMIPFATEVSDLVVSDEGGEVGMAVTAATLAEGSAGRRWTSIRPLSGRVSVRYRMPLHPFERRGPPYGVKEGGLGISGNTSTLLVLPEDLKVSRSTLGWDLSQMVPGSKGVVTGGEGTVTVGGPVDNLLDRWLIAGPLKPAQATELAGFNAYTLGTPPFDAARTMTWARSIYTVLGQAFGYLGEPRYQLFIRTLDAPSYATGTARKEGGGSLITTGKPYWTGQTELDVRNTIAHEMGHQWVGQFDPAGSLWFAEGLNVYVTSTLPCEAKLETWTACAEQISKWAKHYYNSEGSTWSQARIEASPFEREDLRLVSYGRGMMYFANLDAAIRGESGGKRTLLMALRPLFEARRDGVPITPASWEAWLRRTRGDSAVISFRQTVMDGGMIKPDPAAFGSHLEAMPTAWTEDGKVRQGYRWRYRP
jgi:hypothetical protein